MSPNMNNGILDEAKDDSEPATSSHISQSELESIIQWNQEDPEIIDDCAHRLFERQAQQQPDAPAVAAWDVDLSYGELDRAASRLAHHLAGGGDCRVAPGSIVHTCFEKSGWHVVAVLAINKAGAAWAPLDPSHPAQRKRQIVAQTGATVALASPTNSEACRELGLGVVEVSPELDTQLAAEGKGASEATHSAPPPSGSAASPRDAAYVLFTSGSTGTPKGIVMEHGALCTSQAAIGRRLGLAPGVRVLQFASYVFDVSVGEMVAPLVAGACVCVPEEAARLSPRGLAEFVRRRGVTWAFLTPSLAATLDPADFSGLELLMLMGEAVGRDVLEMWFGRVSRLINGWGPTETCVFSAFYEWKSAEEPPNKIGSPVAGRCWVVDAEDPQKLVPIGSTGEIVVQGPTLLREYLGDAELTRAAVVTSVPRWAPRHNVKHWDRLYRTGDLAYHDKDGGLIYLGRKDAQVKLRGLRVELGEIESQIRGGLAGGGVQHVAVDVIRREGGSQVLVAFLGRESREDEEEETLQSNGDKTLGIFRPGPSASAALVETTDYLSTVLPDYMVPHFFLHLRRMPLSLSMKLDRKALRAAVEEMSADKLAEVALVEGSLTTPQQPINNDDGNEESEPSGEYESLRDAWSRLLNINKKYLHGSSHFLSLGGDSIVAIRLADAMRSHYLELPVSLIFQHPQLSDMARQVRHAHGQEEAAPEPFSLLAKKCSRSLMDTVCADCGVSEDSIQDIYPCTPLQVGIMTVFSRQPTCYVINYVYSLPQTVDLARFRAVWAMVHSALAILRTRITLGDDGEYLQVVVKEELSWTQPLAAGEWTRGVSGIATHGMGLGTPLVALGLMPRNNDGNAGHDFSLTIHHAVYDGWSLTSTIKLVEHIYATGKIPPDIPSYNSFVRFVQDKNNAACAIYWRRMLASAPEPSFPPFPRKTYQPLDDSTTTEAVRVPKKQDAPSSGGLTTRATLCHVAWALLLAKYENGDDVVFGCTLSGRNADVRGIGDMHGPTLATVPLRLAFDRDQPVVSLLQAAQKRHSEAMEHEQYGLANISRLGPDERRACGYRTTLIIQTPEFEALQSSDESAVMRLGSSSATLHGAPLTVTVRMGRDSDEITARYDSRLLSEAQVSRLMQQYSHVLSILSGVGSGTGTKISDLDFCSPSDWARILQINPRLPDRLDLCIHDLFRTAAKKHAGRRAVQAWDGAMTYEQLDRLSDRLGRHLARLGVGPETLVPLCFDKSKWAIVAMLGVLKAGGAYVPLDPGHPDARLAMILEDLDAKVAVTSGPHASRLAFAEGLTAVALDETTLESFDDSTSSGTNSSESLTSSVKPHNAAYVLFTSGSTGRPKGIVQTHDAYCTGALGRAETIRRNEESRVLQFASYGFDPSIEDILTTLLYGGCVCVPSNSDRQGDIGLYIRQNACDFANLTPSFAATISPADVPSLKILMTSGEPMTDDFVRAWAPHVTLMNGYGPTETSLKCSINTGVKIGDSPRNIGFPMCANLWVLDPSDPERLAPMGAAGELMVEGPCIARGYLRPGAAAAANGFCEPPGWLRALRERDGVPSTRLFRTGDLVRYASDGSIDYIGRRDFQVKINGQRTELGEIEAQIRRILPESFRLTVQMAPTPRQPDGVLTACVAERAAIRTGGPGSDPVGVTDFSRLSPAGVAAGGWWDDEKLSAATLRERLSRVLPAYMIPRAFFAFDPLPLNINGKVNAREILALLSRERVENTEVEENHVAPEDLTDGERLLLQLWEKSIRADLAQAGPSSNFFDLGGDSLAALRLAAFARRQGLVLPVAAIHENPTLKDMASLATAASSSANSVESSPYVPFSLISHLGDPAEIVRECGERCGVDTGSIEDVYPCTPYQEHFMVHAIWYPGQCVFQGVFPLGADVDLDRFRRAVDVVVQSHHSLRARMTLVNGTWLQVVVKKPKPVEWKPTRSLQQVWRDHTAVTMMDGDELNLFAVVEAEGKKQEKGDGARAQFVWTTNHAISDGWSLSALVQQINTAYAAGTSTLKQESTFGEFIRHAIMQPDDAAVAARQAFWEDHFRGNKSRPLCPSVDSPLVDSVWHREFSPPAPRPDNPLPVSMSTAILAAWGLVVGRETGSPDAVLSLLQLGRDAPLAGVEDMVGLLATAFPFRITTNANTSAAMTTRAFLLATQARLNAARHHQYTHTDFVATRCGEGAKLVPATQTRCVVHPAEFHGGAAPGPRDAVQTRTHRVAVKGECIEVSLSFSYGRGREGSNVVGMDLSFDSRAMGRAAARRLMEGFEMALVQLVGAPAGMCVGDIVWEPSRAVRENGIVETDLSRGPDWTPYPEE
ncbi:NRPS [Diaporthe eres]|uniref:NRPS n=1 Tax=Diaporthe eres TaxID=83184 RepID=A0ABR1PFK3_DIAER